MPLPMVSFVVLAYNRREQTLRAIQRCLAQTYSTKEIITVDNGSSDRTSDAISARFPNVKLLTLPENVGPAAGRNRGWREAKGDYIVFLNDDCWLAEDDAAASLVAQFEADEKAGAVVMRVYDPLAEDKEFDVSGAQRPDAAVETARIATAAFAARRKALEETGGFFELFFRMHLGSDLALRMMNAGWRIFLRGDIAVYHPSADPHQARDLRREVYFNVRNALWLSLRTLRISQWIMMLPPKLWRAFTLSFRHRALGYFFSGLGDGLRRTRVCLSERQPLKREVLRRAQRLGVDLWT